MPLAFLHLARVTSTPAHPTTNTVSKSSLYLLPGPVPQQVGSRHTFHDEHTQMWASSGLKHLLATRSMEAVAQLRDAQGIPVVLRALVSGSLEYTRKQALGVVATLATCDNPTAALELCRANGARQLLSTMRHVRDGAG